jgi:hypothetical protein
MPFRLPNNCRRYFEPLTDKNRKDKLEILFDSYYLCMMVGMYQVKLDSKPDLENTELVDEYPEKYKDSCDFIAALLIATEVKRRPVNIKNADELEKLMKDLLESHSKTRLSTEGERLLNQYASRGFHVISETMMSHTNLEEFYQEYYECFKDGRFLG